ncbi:MAG: hypothetical protein AB7V46_03985, partial [Thermomicrobiales bacterium]
MIEVASVLLKRRSLGMSATIEKLDVPKEVVEALDEIADSMSMTREETLRVAVMSFLSIERDLQNLRTRLQAAAKRKGIETEEDLYAFL